MSHTSDSTPKRRWFHFTRTRLLIGVVLVTAVVGWLDFKTRPIRRQSAAVRAIKEAGGGVLYDYQMDESGSIAFSREPSVPEWQVRLFGKDAFSEVIAVWFDDATVDDTALSHLDGMTALISLELSGTSVTDAGLVRVKDFRNLLWVGLSNTQVTQEGVRELQAALPDCEIDWTHSPDDT